MNLSIIDIDKLKEVLKFDITGIDENSDYLISVSDFMKALRISEVDINRICSIEIVNDKCFIEIGDK